MEETAESKDDDTLTVLVAAVLDSHWEDISVQLPKDGMLQWMAEWQIWKYDQTYGKYIVPGITLNRRNSELNFSVELISQCLGS